MKEKSAMFSILVVVICGLQCVLGLLVIVPLALVLSSTGQKCLLFADTSSYGSESLCSYPIVAAIVCQLVLCLARAVFVVFALKLDPNRSCLNSIVFLIACTAVDVISCVITLVSGSIVSHGFKVMCSQVFHPHPDKCGEIDIYNPASNSFYKDYYQRLKIAEAGVWLSWFGFLLLILLDTLLLRKASIISSSSPSASSTHFLFPGSCCKTGSDVSDEAPEGDTDFGQPTATRYNFTRFHARTGSDTSSPPRTPPPTRPVPARPGYTPAGEAIKY